MKNPRRGRLRIIAGTWRGRRIEVPAGIRPMQDRERERLFSILGSRIEGARVLDLFAGSGAAGLEALSRGAGSALFVENHRGVLPVLRRNLESVGVTAESRVLARSVFSLGADDVAGPFDVASCTPPFPFYAAPDEAGRITALVEQVLGEWLAPGGVLALEHPADLDAPRVRGGGASRTVRTAGSAISLYFAGPPASL